MQVSTDRYVRGVDPTKVVEKLVPNVASAWIIVQAPKTGSTFGVGIQWRYACVSEPSTDEESPCTTNEYRPAVLAANATAVAAVLTA